MDKREEVLAEAINFGVPQQDVIPVGKDPVEFVREHKLVVDVVIDFVGVKDTFAASQQLGKSSSVGSISSVAGTDQALSQVCGQDCSSWSSRARTHDQQPFMRYQET